MTASHFYTKNLRSLGFSVSLIAVGCSNTVQPDVEMSEVSIVDASDRESSPVLRDVLDSGSIEAEVLRDEGPFEWDQTTGDVPTPRDDGGSLNDADDGDAADAATCGPPMGVAPLPGTNRSCGNANGAPAEHCREVWQCGGPFTMGSLDAWIQPGQNRPWRQQNRCDISSGVVHAGFVDAYPVSVARFRAFVRAGTPSPARDAIVFDRQAWNNGLVVRGVARTPPCTFTENPGPNENLPVTCVDYDTSVAFCYWDGKHVATDSAWEFVATNGGRTTRPFAADPSANPCMYGDVLANRCKPLTPTQHFPIDAFPMGQSIDPAGIFGLWGGVYSMLNNSRVPGCSVPFRDGFNENSMDPYFFVVRGISAQEGGIEYEQMSPSRSTRADYYGAGPNHGIRCMRWLPESRG